MAKLICVSLIILISSVFVIAAIDARKQAAEIEGDDSPRLQQHLGAEKVGKIHFYVHDVVAGPDQTVYEVAHSFITSSSATSFGQVRVADDKMTVSADPSSLEIGRVQGLTTSADLTTPALAVNLNFYFTAGRAKGSSVLISGRNDITNKKQVEYPVVGGTGIFRYARGYAVASETEQGGGVFEYTLHVTYNEDNKRSS